MKRLALSGIIACSLLFVFGLTSAIALNIGMAWVGKSGMANRVTQGFEQGIKEFVPDMNIEMHKDLASMDDLAALVGKWAKEKDGQVILRSNGAEWLGENPPSIPTFIGGCNHPAQLGAVKNLEAPEGNITGVTYFLPYEIQFEIFRAILPNMKSVFLYLEKDHPGTPIDLEGTKAVCEKYGIEFSYQIVASPEEAVEAVKANAGKVSAIIQGSQAMLIDNTAANVAAAGDTPVLSYTNKPVEAGALGGFVADDVKLGYMLAESLADVLVKGKAIKDVPVKMDPNPKFFVNAKTAERLGVEIPYEILKAATVIE